MLHRAKFLTQLLLPAAALVIAAPAQAQEWTDWTSRTLSSGTTNGIAAGTLTFGGGSVNVTYTGDVFSPTQTACGTDYWATNPAIYTSPGNGLPTRPRQCDIVSLVGGTGRPPVQTLTFSAPVTDPVMAILSLGQPGVTVLYNFNATFQLLNTGTGHFGGGTPSLFQDAANVLRGIEGHGLIRFTGTYSSISWTAPNPENWHGFTVGAAALGSPTVIPEPSTIVLVGGGLALMGLVARRRRG